MIDNHLVFAEDLLLYLRCTYPNPNPEGAGTRRVVGRL